MECPVCPWTLACVLFLLTVTSVFYSFTVACLYRQVISLHDPSPSWVKLNDCRTKIKVTLIPGFTATVPLRSTHGYFIAETSSICWNSSLESKWVFYILSSSGDVTAASSAGPSTGPPSSTPAGPSGAPDGCTRGAAPPAISVPGRVRWVSASHATVAFSHCFLYTDS